MIYIVTNPTTEPIFIVDRKILAKETIAVSPEFIKKVQEGEYENLVIKAVESIIPEPSIVFEKQYSLPDSYCGIVTGKYTTEPIVVTFPKNVMGDYVLFLNSNNYILPFVIVEKRSTHFVFRIQATSDDWLDTNPEISIDWFIKVCDKKQGIQKDGE